MKSAVCLLAVVPGQGVLAVSRRNDTTRWGLPGGKVDPGETNLAALLREVSEEVGLKLNPLELEPLYCAICPGKGPEDTYWVTTYLYSGDVNLAKLFPEEGLTLTVMPEAQLTSEQHSPFARYNRGVFEALALRVPA